MKKYRASRYTSLFYSPWKMCFIWTMIYPAFFLSAPGGCQSGPEETRLTHKKVKETVFKKHILTSDFISEGVAVSDVNKDGKTDILAGAYWFEAPNWIQHEIDTPQQFSVEEGYSNSFLNFTTDVNNDGWMDFIRVDFPGEGVYWYENPKNKEGHWPSRLIHPSVCNESPAFGDVDGDGSMDMVFSNADQGEMAWFYMDEENSETPWKSMPISKTQAPGTYKFSHGLGIADVNGDKRNDILVKEGWWEAPVKFHTPNWRFHRANLGDDCSQMHTYDFDMDGDNDVIACSAHNYGIWWYEQIRDSQDNRTWEKHTIFDKFSQSHSSALVDVNGDGLPDLVTGKRYFAHNGHDPGGHEPAVLYWFELRHDENNQPRWIPHLIDNNSGSGLNVVVEDISGDGMPDIITANKKGVFYFEQEISGT